MLKKISSLGLVLVGLTLSLPSVSYAQYGGGSISNTPPPTITPPPASPGANPGAAVANLVIDSGAKTVKSTEVNLALPGTDADQMAISNTSDFKNVAWEKYAATKKWTLTPEAGQKTVYIMFRNSKTGAVTKVVQETVQLLATATSPGDQATTPSAGTASVASPSSAGVAPTFTRFLYLGSSGNDVKQLQLQLKELGFYNGEATGQFDNTTKSAVVEFQKDKDLKPYPGWVGPGTRTELNALPAASAPVAPAVSANAYQFTNFLTVGSRGEEVRQLQLKLQELGYYDGPVTGSFGTLTRAAIRKLQQAQGLTPAGYVGPGTRAALNSL